MFLYSQNCLVIFVVNLTAYFFNLLFIFIYLHNIYLFIYYLLVYRPVFSLVPRFLSKSLKIRLFSNFFFPSIWKLAILDNLWIFLSYMTCINIFQRKCARNFTTFIAKKNCFVVLLSPPIREHGLLNWSPLQFLSLKTL